MVKTNPSTVRVLGASLVGTAVEFYDFYVYATAASLVFGPLFFPRSSASAQLLASYGSFGLAFIARPLGAIVFGHFGDRIGRKSTLVLSLRDNGRLDFRNRPPSNLPCRSIGLRRCCFAFCASARGSALAANGVAPLCWPSRMHRSGYRARYGMFPQLGAPVGFVAANGLFLCLGFVLTPLQFETWGWRLPFLASAVLVGLGLWVRLKLTETPAFAAAMAAAPPAKVPLTEVLRDYPREALAGAFRGGRLFRDLLPGDGLRARLRHRDAPL